MILVRVEGVRRGWYAPGNLQASKVSNFASVDAKDWAAQSLDVAPTYLGAVADDAASMYAVVYKVTAEEIAATDEREDKWGNYLKLWLDLTKVTRLNGGDAFPDDAKIRWYGDKPERVTTPTVQSPICESYVDVWLSGAVELEAANSVKDYVKNVINSTYGWSPHWANDRPTPYRPFTREPDAGRVSSELLAVATSNANIVSADARSQ